MAVMHPTAGSFGVYAETYLNPWSGFVVRYTYWMIQVVAVGGEAIAAGVYMTYWFPEAPVWMWSIGFAFILLYVNARSVGNFGSFEYWFAMIKVAAIVLFIILGAAAIFGLGVEPVGLHNLTGLPGGFFPHGLGGMWMAVIMGIFSFNGVELIAVSAGEVRDPRTAIPAALRNMALRLLLFYVIALGIVVTFVPWTETGAKVVAESPFVRVLGYAGLSYAAAIMNFVVISAALSSMNVNIYLSSRMLFSLSRGRYAPELLGRLNHRQTPLAAILVTGIAILCTAAVARLTPLAYNYLFGIALFGALVVWIFILVSHLAFRRRHVAADLPVRMPLFPWLQFAGIAVLVAVLITMGLDTKFWNISWIVGVPWLILVSAAYLVWKAKERGRRANILLQP